MNRIDAIPSLATAVAAALSLAACGHRGEAPGTVATVGTPQACAALATLPADRALPPKTQIRAAVFEAATEALPAHCRIDGDIDARIGVDGQAYAIGFRLRLPQDWNRRFYMGGGGGINGVLVDPVERMKQGYATIGTDSGHDNGRNSRADAGATAAFGLDPQARMDFAYNAYDQVTRAGKALTLASTASHSVTPTSRAVPRVDARPS